MTSGRFWLLALLLGGAAMAAAAGCNGGGAPCTKCPPMEGRYMLQFTAGPLPADCVSLAVNLPQGPLDIQRAGSGLTATLEGVELQGTAFQSFDFNLLGIDTRPDGGSTQFSFSGRYTPGQADGGTGQIAGTFTGDYARESAQGLSRCSIIRDYTAAQQRGQP
jgi:hypothetical protein